jgi:hypothetical protein
MNLYGVLITYNDWPFIQRAVESIYNRVDRIIAVDGRFKDFPLIGDSDFSTDGTREYLLSLEKVQLACVSGVGEIEKRNFYLVGDVGDWYLHLDADEEWKGLVKPPKDADMLIHWLQREKPIQHMKRVRLFRHVPGLHYEGKHYWLRDGNGNTFSLLDRPGKKYRAAETEQLKIIHHELKRDGERQSAKRKYYKQLIKKEGRIKEEV